MRHIAKAVIGLTVLIMLASCTTSYEAKGDAAYKAAQKTEGDEQRLLQKKAYLFYQQAIQARPDKVGNRLRNRFVEMTLNRANMVLSEGSADMGALPLYIEDLDSSMTPEVRPELKTQYANFIMKLADSSFTNQKIYEGLDYIDKALAIAPDKSAIQERKAAVVENLAKDNYEMAKMEYENGKEQKDHEALVRAEYYAKLALYYDEDYPGAQELLSKLYQQNLKTYSAYEAVVTDKPDSNIYYQVNEYDILLAVPTIKLGRAAVAKVSMYNYSYNPLRVMSSNFALVDDKGRKYTATKASRIKKEILDQEHELEKMTLVFPKPRGKIKKLVYEYKDHYTEKNFF
jgi:tetratricopeptide (TPR) repeat protein